MGGRREGKSREQGREELEEDDEMSVCVSQDGREEGGGRARKLHPTCLYLYAREGKGRKKGRKEEEGQARRSKAKESLSKPCRLSLRVKSEAGEIAKHGRGRERRSVCLDEVRKEVGRKEGRANRGRKTCRGEACIEDAMVKRATPKTPPRLLENGLEESGRRGESEG